MDRDTFTRRFREATARAHDFAGRFLEEELPPSLVFRVSLNSSYDGNPLNPDEVVFPGDSSPELRRELSQAGESEAIAALWRAGKVPEWVDVSVVGRTADVTLIQLLCCGRFTENEAILYHEQEGRPPFHVVGPVLPVGYQEGQKFSVYHQAECWAPAELEHVRASGAKKVWSRALLGGAFDDRALAGLAPFEGLEILELRQSPIRGEGLRELARLARLRVLRVELARADATIDLPELPGVTSLSLSNLPASAWGFSTLASRLPALEWLTLAGAGPLRLDGECPDADEVSIAAASVTGELRLPEEIDSLYLHLRDVGEPDLERLLEGVEAVFHLDLSGTPVGDELARKLATRWSLDYLNLVGTRVSHEALRELADRYPRLRLRPDPSKT